VRTFDDRGAEESLALARLGRPGRESMRDLELRGADRAENRAIVADALTKRSLAAAACAWPGGSVLGFHVSTAVILFGESSWNTWMVPSPAEHYR
jgi:hypothetical protein